VGHCTIADYALYPYTRLADESGFNLNEFPSVERWLEQIEAEAGYIPMRTDGALETRGLLSIAKLVRSASKRASLRGQ
jgi:glutathione S-transferase